MPGLNILVGGTPVHLDVVGCYKPGDPPPDGYLDRQEWAEVQMAAGLKPAQCCWCCKWFFPQGLSDRKYVFYASMTKRGPRNVRFEEPMCKACAAKHPPQPSASASA